MSIEDRSLDALKEEGTATVIDGSDDDWSRVPMWLFSMGRGYLNIQESDGSLKANGVKKDDAAKFEVSIIGSDPHQIVMLKHIKTEKVVAIKKEEDNSATVITKKISGTLEDLNNLHKVETNHPDILFQKIPKEEGSALFHLKPYRVDTRMVGFDTAGDPIMTTTAVAESNNHEVLFTTYN